MSVISEKFTIKYAPKSLDDVILPERIKNKLKGGAKQHLMLYGPPGTGKTSTAIAIAKQYKIPYLYINSSEETSIDVIREKLSKFCSTLSIMDGERAKTKLVILDEIDGVSDQFNKALKAALEKFETTSRFIATTNHINKIPDAVQSRFECISYSFTDDEEKDMMKAYMKAIYAVAKNEGIKFTKESLIEFVKRKFPDMRAMLNTLQGYHNENKTDISVEDVIKFNSIHKDIYELIFNNEDPVENYKYIVSNYSNKIDEVLSTLGTDFIDYIQIEQPGHINKIPEIIITVAAHQAQRVHVIDTVVTLLACIYKIQTILKT